MNSGFEASQRGKSSQPRAGFLLAFQAVFSSSNKLIMSVLGLVPLECMNKVLWQKWHLWQCHTREVRVLLYYIINQLHDLIIIYIIQRTIFSQMTLSFLSFCHKRSLQAHTFRRGSNPCLKFRQNCFLLIRYFCSKFQTPSKTPLICPRIASNAFDVYLMPEAKIIALRCLKMCF